MPVGERILRQAYKTVYIRVICGQPILRSSAELRKKDILLAARRMMYHSAAVTGMPRETALSEGDLRVLADGVFRA